MSSLTTVKPKWLTKSIAFLSNMRQITPAPQRSLSPFTYNPDLSFAEVTSILLRGKYHPVKLPGLKPDRSKSQVRKRATPFRAAGLDEDWNDLNSLPVARLRQFIPAKEVELDDSNVHLGATVYLLEQRAKLDLATQQRAAKLQGVRTQARAALIDRHRKTEALERRTGVVKLRQSSPTGKLSFDGSHSAAFISPFGFTKNYQASPRLREMSQPRSVFHPKNPLLYADFRGLKQAENAEAMKRLRSNLNLTATSGLESLRYTREAPPATPFFS